MKCKSFHLTEGLLRSWKCWWLWKKPVVGCIGGSEKNQCDVWKLECQSSNVTASVEWPPSALMHTSNPFHHWSVASFTTLCWNLAHIATSHCCNSSVSQTGTRYTCSSCSMSQAGCPTCRPTNSTEGRNKVHMHCLNIPYSLKYNK